MDELERRCGTERLARRLDSGSSLFLFGYYLRALEEAAENGRRSGEGVPQTKRLLGRLHETALRSEALVPLCAEVADVARLVDEKTGGTGRLDDGLAALLDRCAKRWFQRVRELPRHRNSLAVDIAFNLELAGLEELSADLYEAILCLEAGAFRASRLMSGRALDKALEKAGAAGEALERRLARAKETGLITSSDLRSAIANFAGTPGASDPGEMEGAKFGTQPPASAGGRVANRGAADGPEDEDESSAEWALESALRLAKKLLKAELEAGLRKASAGFGDLAGPVR